MGTWSRIVAAAVAVAACVVPTLAAQTPAAAFVGQRVVDVQIVAEGRPVDDPMIMGLVETRIGDPLSMAKVRESITHLFGLGRYQDVQVDATPAAGGVALRYNLVPLHNVQRVDFRGTPSLGLSEDVLRDAVSGRFGASPPPGRAQEIARFLEQLYHDRGFLTAVVVANASERHDPDRTLLQFNVTPGSRATIGSVAIEGSPAEGREAFLKRIHASPGAGYEPLQITDELSKYVQRLRRKSRYLAAGSYSARPSDDLRTVALTVSLVIGPTVTIVFEGDPIPREKQSELVPIAREASVDEDLIEDAIQRIRTFLNQQGHWKADATASRQEGDGALRVVFTVHRGPQYRVTDRGVEMRGNRAIPTEQFRSALVKLQANEVFIESNLSAAVSAIAGQYQRLGYAQAKVSAAVDESTDGDSLSALASV